MNSIAHGRVYDPAAIQAMGWAFDRAFAGLSKEPRQRLHMRRELALCILRLFDSGQTKPLQLSRTAQAIFSKTNRNTISVLFPSDTNRRPVAA